MRQHLSIIFLFFFLISTLLPINNFVSVDNNIIVNAQSWENSYGKLEVYPDTSTEMVRQKQWANLTWYYPDNTLTVAFGFPHQLDYGKLYRIVDSEYIQVTDITHIKYNNQHYYETPDFNVEQDHTYYYYWEYDAVGSGKWDLYAKLASDTWQEAFSSGRYIHLDPWWDSDWGYCSTWWINHAYIGSTLSNFPVLFNISSTMASNCQADGGDLRFLDSTNTTQYAYEIEYWDPAGTSYVWVNVTSVSSSSKTAVNMYYGNPTVVNGSNPTGVWDSNYILVMHGNSTGATVGDSTGQRDGTKPYTIQPAQVTTGQVYYAQDFEADAHVGINATKSGGMTQLTVDCWFKPESYGATGVIIKSSHDTGSGYGDTSWSLTYLDNRSVAFMVSDGSAFQSGYTYTAVTDGPQRYAGVYYATKYLTVINNLTLVNDPTISGTMPNPSDAVLRIGYDYYNTGMRQFLDGILDEVRISDIVRSYEYLNASFHTTNMTIGFLSADGEQANTFIYPTFFNASTQQSGNINLNWTKNPDATNTVIEWNTVDSWSRGSGTTLYNDTGTSTTHTSLGCGIKYYYQAWSFNSTTSKFSNSIVINNISCPANPGSSTATVYGTYLNITWVLGTYGDNTTLVRNTGSYPTSPTDGTVLYNGSNTWYNNTYLTTYYYKLFTWNTTVQRHSTGLNRGWGGLTINVYDANTSQAITNWDLFISNNDGTSTYESKNNSNPLIIDIALLPYGTNTIIIINATNYTKSIYYMNLEVNNQYTLNAHLQKTNVTQIFLLNVVGPKTEYNTDPPIQNANINIQRYINATVGYEQVASLITDANGYAYVSLEADIIYIVNISCTGYITSASTFIPTSAIQVYTFRLTYESGTTITKQWDLFQTNISFIIDIVDAGYNNLGNLTITYNDKNTSTTNTDIYIYELYNGISTLINYSHNTSDSFNLNNQSINTSRSHYAVLFFNNTADFSDVISPYTVYHDALYVYGGPTIPSSFDERVRNIVGPAPLNVGWHTIIGAGIAIALLLLFGPYNAGLGIIGAGLSIGLSDALFSGSFPVLFVTICPLLIAIGIIYIWVKGGSDQL